MKSFTIFTLISATSLALTGCATTAPDDSIGSSTKVTVPSNQGKVVNVPFELAKQRLTKMQKKCVSVVMDGDPRIINKSAASMRYYYDINELSSESFQLLSQRGFINKPDKVNTLLSLLVEKVDDNHTRFITQKLNFFNRSELPLVMQWVNGEHEMCD